MPLKQYHTAFNKYFESNELKASLGDALTILKGSKRIFFLGNGGSNSICSHMMEDYAKMGRFQTFAFSDAALITCSANDYGYENAMMEWLKIHFQEGDVLIGVSSSGNSKNILNAADYAQETKGKIITCSGFKENNPLRQKGDVNFYIGEESYGVVECYHQVILHVLLDSYCS